MGFSDRRSCADPRRTGCWPQPVMTAAPSPSLRGLPEEFLRAGAQVLQALTFFATREKLTRAGYGPQTEAINMAAVRIAREIAGDQAMVAGSVSRTQLLEREGPAALSQARDLF